MKSIVMKSIYAGLGLLGSGKATVEQIGKQLAKKAALSEQEGERIAKELRDRSEKAIKALEKTLEKEVDQVVRALHAATTEKKAPAKKARTAAKPAKKKALAKH